MQFKAPISTRSCRTLQPTKPGAVPTDREVSSTASVGCRVLGITSGRKSCILGFLRPAPPDANGEVRRSTSRQRDGVR